MSSQGGSLQPCHHWMIKKVSQDLSTLIKQDLLIYVAFDICYTVIVVGDGHHLVSMPCEIDVKRWNKEGCGRRGHQVQESVEGVILTFGRRDTVLTHDI